MLEEKVLKTIKENELLQEGDKVLVAVSGGPDSVALLHFLNTVGSYKLHVFHLNHMLRKSADRDAQFVKELANSLKLSITILNYDVAGYAKEKKLSKQDAARKVRYRLLDQTANKIKADKIALGHNANDQIETFILRMLRGATLKGLRAMPVRRGIITRPLIDVTRDEIIGYLNKKKVRYVIDPSNLKPIYLRNKLRLQVMPLLEQFNPNFYEVMLNNLKLISDDDAFIDSAAKEAYSLLTYEINGLLYLKLREFELLPSSLQRRLILRAIESLKKDLQGIESQHVEDIRNKYTDESFRLSLPGRIIVFKEYTKLVFANKAALRKIKIVEKEILLPGTTSIEPLGINIKSTILSPKQCLFEREVACIDNSTIELPLRVRSRKPGDGFIPLGMKKKRKLQDFFVDLKIPSRQRDLIPIIEDTKSIIWVAGYQIDERAKVTDKTKKVIRLKIEES